MLKSGGTDRLLNIFRTFANKTRIDMIFKAYTDLRQELKKHHAFGIVNADAHERFTISMLHSLFVDYGISREREFVFSRNCFEQLPCVSYYDEGKLHKVGVESVDWDYAYVIEGKYNKYEVALSDIVPHDLEYLADNIKILLPF